MNILYHWIGVLSFWCTLLASLIFGALVALDSKWFAHMKRRASHLRLWFRVLAFNQRMPVYKSGVRMLFMMASRKRDGFHYDWWERNLAADMIRHARRNGYADQN